MNMKRKSTTTLYKALYWSKDDCCYKPFPYYFYNGCNFMTFAQICALRRYWLGVIIIAIPYQGHDPRYFEKLG